MMVDSSAKLHTVQREKLAMHQQHSLDAFPKTNPSNRRGQSAPGGLACVLHPRRLPQPPTNDLSEDVIPMLRGLPYVTSKLGHFIVSTI